jgi:PKD repeat protein
MISAQIDLYKIGESGQKGSGGLYLDIVPITFKFEVEVLSGSPTSFHWDFGDGGTSTLIDPEHTYADIGHYRVALTASDGVDSSTCLFDLYLGRLDFSAESVRGLPPFTVELQNQSASPTGCGFTGYQWSYGDGATGMIGDISHVYSVAGKYSVGLSATLVR